MSTLADVGTGLLVCVLRVSLKNLLIRRHPVWIH
jgi:hypothetical protein